MGANENPAVDLLARLVEDRPNNKLAGVAEDRHGTFCIYCGARGWDNRLRPDHRRDRPIRQGQRLLERIYGEDEDAR